MKCRCLQLSLATIKILRRVLDGIVASVYAQIDAAAATPEPAQ